MTDDEDDLQREIRQGRKFTPEEAMARMAGPGSMKGASPVSPQKQAEIEVGNWLNSHVDDTAGALRSVLHRHIAGSAALADNPEQPLEAVGTCLRRIHQSDQLLKDLVRLADAEWGRMMDERPFFDRDDVPPASGDPYTLQSVRAVLSAALTKLPSA